MADYIVINKMQGKLQVKVYKRDTIRMRRGSSETFSGKIIRKHLRGNITGLKAFPTAPDHSKNPCVIVQ